MKSMRSIVPFVSLLLILSLILIPLPAQATFSSPPAIRLQYATFDPLAGEPAVPAGQRLSIQAGRPATYLVQFSGPVREAWKAAVQGAGARLYGYVPDQAFIARMEAATAERVRDLPFVRWVGAYHPAYRLAATLPATTAAVQAVTVQTLPDADLEALTQQVAAWGGRVQDRAVTAIAGYLRLELPGARLLDLAALDGVLWVEPYFVPTLDNDVGGGTIMRAGETRNTLGLYGAGQTVCVADTGLDTGTTGAAMSDDFEGRIVEGQAICGDFGGRTTWNDFDAHGTHVAGSVLGSGANSGSNPSAHDYAGSFAGVAPEAQLVFQAIDNDPNPGLECIPLDMAGHLMGPAYDLGARVHTNSWGGPTGGTPTDPEYGGYNDMSRIVDEVAWNYPQMLILYSAGNNGTDADANGVVDPDSLGSPGTAKNALTVGASENLRTEVTTRWGDWWPDDFSAAPIVDDLMGDDADGMAPFSSRGPTDDGRVKPDVVAPGAPIVSARSHDPGAGTGWGVYDEHYLYMGGTSMSTPLTAGAAAVVREWYTARGVTSPSGALLKATLINGAVDMSPGQYGPGATQEIPAGRPNNVTGWGRVDLLATLSPPAPVQLWHHDGTAGLSTGGQTSFELTLTAGQVGAVSHEPDRQPQLSAALPPVQGESPASLWSGAGSQDRTWPPPVQPRAADELLQNRSFESASGGTLDVWQDNSGGWYVNQTGVDAHTGTYSAFMGGYQGEPGLLLYQGVDFPADATAGTLQVYLEGLGLGSDTIEAQLWIESGDNDTLVDTQSLNASNDAWTENTWDLSSSTVSALQGEYVWVVFYAMMAATDSFYLVDDASLLVTTGGSGGEPSLTISPDSGPRGTAFAVTGSGFSANDTVTIAVDGEDQFDVSSDGSGAFGFDLTPPGTISQGQHTVTATDTGGHSASDTLTVVPQVSVNVSPSSGQAGDSFTVTGSGFRGGSTITVKLDGNADGTATAANDGSFTYNLNTPGSIAAGTHTVSATDDENSTGTDTFTIGGGGGQGGPFRVTLAWTDYPGEPAAAKALVNDLDLEVIAPDGTHYYGNGGLYSGGQCLRGGQWDACNNVEGVLIPEAEAGTYTVVVHGYSVAQGPQPFALVASGDGLAEGGQPGETHRIYLPLVTKGQ